jgi:hypothetical protein
MTGRDVPRGTSETNAVLEALIELARAAARNDAEASGRRAKMRAVEPKRRGGRAA